MYRTGGDSESSGLFRLTIARERDYRYTLPEDEKRGREAEEECVGRPEGRPEGGGVWRHDPNSF